MSEVIFWTVLVAGFAATALATGIGSFRGGRRTRLWLGLGGPAAVLLLTWIAFRVGDPCADATGDCYDELVYLALAALVLIAVVAGAAIGSLAGYVKDRRSGT